MTLKKTFLEASGVDFITPVTFQADLGITTLVGGTASVAMILNNGTKVQGSAVIVDETHIRCTFAAWSIPTGSHTVQLIAAPLGFPAKTILDEVIAVKQSAWPRP